jgi:hypothetical protein
MSDNGVAFDVQIDGISVLIRAAIPAGTRFGTGLRRC